MEKNIKQQHSQQFVYLSDDITQGFRTHSYIDRLIDTSCNIIPNPLHSSQALEIRLNWCFQRFCSLLLMCCLLTRIFVFRVINQIFHMKGKFYIYLHLSNIFNCLEFVSILYFNEYISNLFKSHALVLHYWWSDLPWRLISGRKSKFNYRILDVSRGETWDTVQAYSSGELHLKINIWCIPLQIVWKYRS